MFQPSSTETIMGEVRINLSNFITIGLLAYVGVWAINKGLEKAGYPQWAA